MTKQMVKTEAKEVAVMSELEELQNAGGFVEVRKELMSIPRLQLGQSMSDTVQAGLGKVGEFVSKVKGKNYGTSVKIIPLLVSESAALLDKDTSKLVCRSDNMIVNMDGIQCSNCPHGQYWNSWNKNKSPECRTSIDVVCIVNDEMDMPQILSFRKTSYKAGKALLNLIMHDKLKVPFGSSYELKSTQQTKDAYKYFVIEDSITATPLTMEQVSKLIPLAKQLVSMKKQGRVIHEEEETVVEVDKERETIVEEDQDLPI